MSGFPFGMVFIGLVTVVSGFMFALKVQEVEELKKNIADLKRELGKYKEKLSK